MSLLAWSLWSLSLRICASTYSAFFLSSAAPTPLGFLGGLVPLVSASVSVLVSVPSASVSVSELVSVLVYVYVPPPVGFRVLAWRLASVSLSA